MGCFEGSVPSRWSSSCRAQFCGAEGRFLSLYEQYGCYGLYKGPDRPLDPGRLMCCSVHPPLTTDNLLLSSYNLYSLYTHTTLSKDIEMKSFCHGKTKTVYEVQNDLNTATIKLDMCTKQEARDLWRG